MLAREHRVGLCSLSDGSRAFLYYDRRVRLRVLVAASFAMLRPAQTLSATSPL
jgi:hypothetical protein